MADLAASRPVQAPGGAPLRPGHEARAGARPVIELLARAGYAARGAVNLLVASFAIYAAIVAPGAKPTGSKGAMVELWSNPFGTILLALLAVGLAGFALWRFLQGLADADRHGTAPKALLRRAAYTVTGIIYVGLAA